MTATPPNAGTDRSEGRRRRRPGEARELIVRSARELFARQGYESTSFRDIADSAQVSESLIFRGFRTKAALFEEAVLVPFQDYISAYMEYWKNPSHPLSNEETVERFTGGLFDLLSTHRDLVGALVAARYSFRVSGQAGEDSMLSQELDALAELVAGDAEMRQVTGTDLAISFRLVVGQVMAAVLLDEWLFPQGDRHPTHQQVRDELLPLVRFGVERPA